jgi:hypothetical protein
MGGKELWLEVFGFSYMNLGNDEVFSPYDGSCLILEKTVILGKRGCSTNVEIMANNGVEREMYSSL